MQGICHMTEKTLASGDVKITRGCKSKDQCASYDVTNPSCTSPPGAPTETHCDVCSYFQDEPPIIPDKPSATCGPISQYRLPSLSSNLTVGLLHFKFMMWV